MRWRAEQIAKDPAFEWKTAINFYGLVIDENNQPLSGADVKWITTNVTGNGHGSTTSGYDGRFYIETAGKGMDVIVTKNGYRTVERTANFEFADFTRYDYYDHDKDHPAIFHLRKIPPYEPFYYWTGAVRDNLAGNKITVDPQTGRVIQGESPLGMWIQFVPGPQNSPDRGQYEIVLGTASGSGAFLVTGDTDTNAPESGYQTPLDTKITVDYVGQRFINMNTFFKDGSGHYGSMSLDIELGGNKLTLGYLLKYNPSGGTSLSAPAHSSFQINKNAY